MQRWPFVILVSTLCLAASCEAPTPSGPMKSEAALPSGMVFVPAGPFIMGSDDGQIEERPKRKVTVTAFFIDQHEVTNEEYSKFLLATHRIPPPKWMDPHPPKGKEKFPVVNVTMFEAEAYAAWAGKRLPTEAEWEKAARGEDGRLYPWGDRWDPTMGATSVIPRPVDEFRCAASPYGCIGMEGNAREWTSSPYTMAIKPDAGGVPPFAAPFAALFAWLELKSKYPKQLDTLQSLGGQATDTRVVKGGPEPTFLLQRTAFECRVSFREAWKATTRDETLGFRCAKNAP